MSETPTAPELQRVRRGLRRVQTSAVGLGIAAVALGAISAVLLGEPAWLLVSAAGLVWSTGMVSAMRATLKAADRPPRNTSAPPSAPGRGAPARRPAAGETRTFRLSHKLQVAFFGTFAFFMGLMAIPAFTAPDGSVVVGVWVMLFAALMARGTWQAARGRVRISATSVTTTGTFGTKTFSIAEVDRVVRGRSTGGWVSWPIAVLLLRGGRRVQLTPTATWRTRRSQQQLEALIDDMNAALGVGASDHGSADIPGSPGS